MVSGQPNDWMPCVTLSLFTCCSPILFAFSLFYPVIVCYASTHGVLLLSYAKVLCAVSQPSTATLLGQYFSSFIHFKNGCRKIQSKFLVLDPEAHRLDCTSKMTLP